MCRKVYQCVVASTSREDVQLIPAVSFCDRIDLEDDAAVVVDVVEQTRCEVRHEVAAKVLTMLPDATHLFQCFATHAACTALRLQCAT